MCDPVTVAAATMTVASVGSAVSGYEGAKAQATMQNRMYEQNKLNAYSALRTDYQATQQRQMQEIEAASQQIEQRRLESLQQQATANVAAGEAGVSGFSVERVLRDIGAKASRDISTIEQNRDWGLSQLQNEMRGQRDRAVSRIFSVPKAMKPSALPYIFQGMGGAAQSYGTFKLGQSGG